MSVSNYKSGQAKPKVQCVKSQHDANMTDPTLDKILANEHRIVVWLVNAGMIALRQFIWEFWNVALEAEVQ